MNQAEYKDHRQEIRRFHSKILLKAPHIVEALVADGERNNGIYEVIIGLDSQEGGTNKRNTVPECECRDKFYDIPEFTQEEYDGEEEE